MPIDRINIGKSVGPGGASSRSAASAFNPHGNDGPDLGRLLGALGKGMKTLEKVSDDGQQREMDEAEVEIRSVMLKTENERQAGESPEDHRSRLDGEISKVRDKWANRDRGFLDNMFQKDDKALDTVDSIHAQSKSLDLRHTLTLLRTQNPHLTTEEYMQKAGNIMEKGFSELGHMGTKHRRDFLRSVNDHTLSEVKTMAAQAEKTDQNLNLQKNFSTAYAMQEDTIGTALGTTPEEANKNLESFTKFHNNWEANKEGMTAGILGSAKQVYANALVISRGDKIKASEQALTFAISIAERTGRPEILDAVADMPLGDQANGRSLRKFYAKQIDDTKKMVAQNVVKREHSLQNKKDSMTASKNKQHYEHLTSSIDEQVAPAIQSGDPEAVEGAFDEVRYRISEHQKALASGQYLGNEAHGKRVSDYLYSTERMMIREEGKPEARERLAIGLANRTWSIDDHNKWAPSLSPEDKAKSFEKIKPLLELDQEARSNIRILEKQRHLSVVTRPVQSFVNTWSHELDSNKAAVDAINKNPDIYGAAITDPAQLKAQMMFDINDIEGDLALSKYYEDGTQPTEQERRDALKPTVDKYMKAMDAEKKRIDEAAGKLEKDQLDSPDSEIRQRIDPAIQKAESGEELTNEEVDAVLEGAPLGLTNIKQVQSALVNGIRNNDFKSPSEIFSYIADRYAFDLSSPDGKQFVRTLLERGMQDKTLNNRIKSLKPGINQKEYEALGLEITEDDYIIHETTTGGGSMESLNVHNAGQVLSRALEDNELVTREGLRSFFESNPFNTLDFNSKGMSATEQEAERKRLVEAEIDSIIKIFDKVNKKNKQSER